MCSARVSGILNADSQTEVRFLLQSCALKTNFDSFVVVYAHVHMHDIIGMVP